MIQRGQEEMVMEEFVAVVKAEMKEVATMEARWASDQERRVGRLDVNGGWEEGCRRL